MYISIDNPSFAYLNIPFQKACKAKQMSKVVNQLGMYGDGLFYLFILIALFTCSVLKYSLFMAALVCIYLNRPFIKVSSSLHRVFTANDECSITLDAAGVPFLTQSVQPSVVIPHTRSSVIYRATVASFVNRCGTAALLRNTSRTRNHAFARALHVLSARAR